MAAHMLLSERSKNEVGCEVSRVLEELCLSRGEALGCNIEATQVGELPLFLQGCLCRVHDYCNALGTSRSWVAGGILALLMTGLHPFASHDQVPVTCCQEP